MNLVSFSQFGGSSFQVNERFINDIGLSRVTSTFSAISVITQETKVDSSWQESMFSLNVVFDFGKCFGVLAGSWLSENISPDPFIISCPIEPDLTAWQLSALWPVRWLLCTSGEMSSLTFRFFVLWHITNLIRFEIC